METMENRVSTAGSWSFTLLSSAGAGLTMVRLRIMFFCPRPPPTAEVSGQCLHPSLPHGGHSRVSFLVRLGFSFSKDTESRSILLCASVLNAFKNTTITAVFRYIRR